MNASLVAPGAPRALNRRRKLPRDAALAATASIAVHVAVAGYIAVQVVTSPATTDTVEPPAVVVETYRPAEPPRPSRPPRPHIRFNDAPRTAPPVEPLPIERIEDPPELPPLSSEPPADLSAGPAAPAESHVPPSPPPLPPQPRIIRKPAWLQRPNAAQMARLYPERAQQMGLGGGATLLCEVLGSGAVRNCAVVEETPKGRGFGPAALAAAPYFMLSPRTENGETIEGAKVRIPLVFNPGG